MLSSPASGQCPLSCPAPDDELADGKVPVAATVNPPGR